MDAKKWIALSSVVASSLFAANEQQMNVIDKRVSKLEKRYEQLKKTTVPVGVEYLDSDANVNLFADFLWWYAEESGLGYAVEAQYNATGTEVYPKKVRHVDFRFRPGFRVGAALNTGHDQWRLGLDWVHLDAKADGAITLSPISEGANTRTAFNSWNVAIGNNEVNKARAEFKIDLNQVDATLFRPYWIGRYTSLGPKFGVRGARIDTRYQLRNSARFASGLGSQPQGKAEYSQNFEGAGLLFGLQGGWYFNKTISLYSSGALSLLFSENTIKKQDSFTNAPEKSDESFSARSKVRTTQPELDLAAGLKLEFWLFKRATHLALNLGWEHHSLPNFNRLFKEMNPTFIGAMSESNGSLSFSGGVARISLHF